eukprot:10089394-Lingulodinium_polyedra.AAC.1
MAAPPHADKDKLTFPLAQKSNAAACSNCLDRPTRVGRAGKIALCFSRNSHYRCRAHCATPS